MKKLFVLYILSTISVNGQIPFPGGGGGGGGGVSFTNPTITTGTGPIGPIYALNTLSTTNYSWTNQGGSVLNTSTGFWYITFPSNATDQIRAFTKSYPAGNFTFNLGFSFLYLSANTPEVGLCITDGTGYEILAVGSTTVSSSGSVGYRIDAWTNSTTFNSSKKTAGFYGTIGSMIWFQLVDDGTTNRTWSFGLDGVHWHQLLQESRTAFVTPTKIGFCGNNTNSGENYDVQIMAIPN